MGRLIFRFLLSLEPRPVELSLVTLWRGMSSCNDGVTVENDHNNKDEIEDRKIAAISILVSAR